MVDKQRIEDALNSHKNLSTLYHYKCIAIVKSRVRVNIIKKMFLSNKTCIKSITKNQTPNDLDSNITTFLVLLLNFLLRNKIKS